MRRERNLVWVLSAPRLVLPRGRWRSDAIDGARIRHGAGVEISDGSVSVGGLPAGVCMVVEGKDGTKTVLSRFARPIA